MQLSVEIPDQYILFLAPEDLVKRLKMNTAIEMYQNKLLSVGAASEFAGIERIEFLFECHKRGIEPRTYVNEQELEDEVEMLKRELI